MNRKQSKHTKVMAAVFDGAFGPAELCRASDLWKQSSKIDSAVRVQADSIGIPESIGIADTLLEELEEKAGCAQVCSSQVLSFEGRSQAAHHCPP